MDDSFPVRKVANADRWIERRLLEPTFKGLSVPRLLGSGEERLYSVSFSQRMGGVELIRGIYDKKIGELGSHWSNCMMIDFKYAKIKMGDVIDFYTTSDGVLQVPAWASFKFAEDEYLEEVQGV